MTITVVVVTHNSTEVLADCLASMPSAFDGLEYELVVVDNASTDHSVQLVGELAPDAVLLSLGRNLGYAAGINAGITVGGPRNAVMVLNPDVRLAPGAVRPLLVGLHRPGVGITVPRIHGPTGALDYSLRRDPTPLRALGEAVLGGRRAGRYRMLGEVVALPTAYEVEQAADWATGAAMLISRACLEAVVRVDSRGSLTYWDESFFLYSEETEFALRARDAGFRLHYIPHSQVVHIGGESRTSPELWRLLTVNRVRLYARRHGRAATLAFWAAAVVNEALRAGSRTHRAALRDLLLFPDSRPRGRRGKQ